jgi:hypothetical protein
MLGWVTAVSHTTIFLKVLFRLMLRIDHECSGQTSTDLRRLTLTATHACSRERFIALHDVAQGACAMHNQTGSGRQGSGPDG